MHHRHDHCDPVAVATEATMIRQAYRGRYRPGDRDGTALIAAIGLYRERHPEVPRGEAAHIVSEMIRSGL